MRKVITAITERAVIQRINRRLKPDGHQLKATRGFWDANVHYEDNNLGRYYVLNLHCNCVSDHHINLEDFARGLGVMAAWEELAPPTEPGITP